MNGDNCSCENCPKKSRPCEYSSKELNYGNIICESVSEKCTYSQMGDGKSINCKYYDDNTVRESLASTTLMIGA